MLDVFSLQFSQMPRVDCVRRVVLTKSSAAGTSAYSTMKPFMSRFKACADTWLLWCCPKMSNAVMNRMHMLGKPMVKFEED